MRDDQCNPSESSSNSLQQGVQKNGGGGRLVGRTKGGLNFKPHAVILNRIDRV